MNQPRMTLRYKTKQPGKDKVLTTEIKRLTKKHKRYGYRMITAKLRQVGWNVNHKRVQRIEHVGTLYIEPGSPWENGYIESFNGKLRDEILNREVFYSVKEAKVIVED